MRVCVTWVRDDYSVKSNVVRRISVSRKKKNKTKQKLDSGTVPIV